MTLIAAKNRLYIVVEIIYRFNNCYFLFQFQLSRPESPEDSAVIWRVMQSLYCSK